MADRTVTDGEVEYKLYVYVIESEAGVIKVGFSGDPQNRLLGLLTGHPFGLEVAYTRHHEQAPLIEKIAHRILAPTKIRNEWFKCSKNDAIAAVDAAFDILQMTTISLAVMARKVRSQKAIVGSPIETTAKMKARGMTIPAIASKLGKSERTISRWLAKAAEDGRPSVQASNRP